MENLSTTENLRNEFLKSWNYEMLHFSPELIASVIDVIGKEIADGTMAYDLVKEYREQVYFDLVIKHKDDCKNIKHLEAKIIIDEEYKLAKEEERKANKLVSLWKMRLKAIETWVMMSCNLNNLESVKGRFQA